METLIRATCVSAILWPIGGWALMLILGILHHEAAQSIQPLGFWICMALVMLASFVKSAVSPNMPDDK